MEQVADVRLDSHGFVKTAKDALVRITPKGLSASSRPTASVAR